MAAILKMVYISSANQPMSLQYGMQIQFLFPRMVTRTTYKNLLFGHMRVLSK